MGHYSHHGSSDPRMPTDHTDPTEMSNAELYAEYQHAKQHGPVLHIDELQREIAERWEARHERVHENDDAENAVGVDQ